MKFLLVIVLFGLNLLNAQSFETSYSRNYTSSYCLSEKFNFDFDEGILKKTDYNIGLTEKFVSRLESSNYEDGYYYEIWSPSWYLGNYGVQEYDKLTKRAYKLLFYEKGGKLLYIYEFDLEKSSRSGKFHFTQQGYEIYCK